MGGFKTPSKQAQDLNQKSLGEIVSIFRELPIPDPAEWVGPKRGEVVGPIWVRASEGPANVSTGVRGWIGKEFYRDLRGHNLVRRGGEVKRVAPLTIQTVTSFIDGKEGPAIVYPDAAFPVNRVRDEFRALDDGCLLCMINYDLPIMRNFLFPFLLHKDPTVA